MVKKNKSLISKFKVNLKDNFLPLSLLKNYKQ